MRLYGTMKIDNNGVLNIGGISTVELVNKYGSPIIVMDEEEIRNNMRKYIEAFDEYYPNSKTAYAGKAFINRTLCKIIDDEGLGLDVVSDGELYTALQADFPAEKIYFHGNNKTLFEIKMALDAEIGKFMVDNLQEAYLINDLADKPVEVILRVTPGIEAHTHEFIQTGQLDSKFGVSIYRDQALAVIKEIIEMDNLILTGIHAHIGSQIFNLSSFAKAIIVMMEFMAEIREKTGLTLKELDIGGGLGIAYTKEEDNPSVVEYAKIIAEEVKRQSEILDFPQPVIINEPGRSIVGTAGTTLYTIGTIKDIPSIRKYIAIDGGMTDNIRPALYDANYEAAIANKAEQETKEMVTVAGKCCESGDILIKDIKLQEAETGDVLAVSCTGAYTYAMASNYNGVTRPAVVLVYKGKDDLIIKRESNEDLIKNDIIPDRFQEKEVSLQY